jgi:hypothetical protein
MPAKPLPPPAPADEALHSVHTTNLPALFAQLQISLLVTTSQAGKLIVVRNDGNVLNTHFLCHLNGLGMVDGHPRYVTALGETDAAGERERPGGARSTSGCDSAGFEARAARFRRSGLGGVSARSSDHCRHFSGPCGRSVGRPVRTC